ncbi:proteasome activator pa28 beta subunit protein [Besnoitia besnoiti]|uniref:Proteasome activator pa28 beta subunit protein n=1 Tax=Besnoitia besnoiti TaxID=94643 RepID=A0A2A9MIX6_BESBE|nr:proteasome activator pa28 beta subunit protein [Besnoitia besnoiti]PFH35332.1 proteasome activator pa28 beta subunit protein [Besnoitia besnoiti]
MDSAPSPPVQGVMRRLESSEVPETSLAPGGPRPAPSASLSSSSFPSSASSLAAAAASPTSPAAGNKKRPRTGTGGGGSDRGIAEAVRLMQSGKLAKLEPSEEKVKEEYEQYRNDVTRRALQILTDDLPRRIVQFLRLVDVNAEPGALLVSDDLPSPVLRPLLTEEELASYSVKPVEASEESGAVASSAFSHAASPAFRWSFSVEPLLSLSAPDSARLRKFLQDKVNDVFSSGRGDAPSQGAPDEAPARKDASAAENGKAPSQGTDAGGAAQASSAATSAPSCAEKQEAICVRLGQQAQFVKEEAVAMRELLNAVKIFMQLHVPRIEDGNNFGVAIQEEAIHLLNRVEESAFNLYDTVLKYYLARAKLCSKLVKYPNTLDYQMAIVELDRKEWVHLKITNLDLRNNYIMLYDLICKNWQNVIAPKGRNQSTSQLAFY